MPYISDSVANTFRDNPDKALFFRLAVSPDILRLWSGPGDCLAQINNVDSSPAIYRGIGAFSGVPELTQLINGIADRVDFTLSGIDPETYFLIDDDVEIRNKKTTVALGVFDDTAQLATNPVALWTGRSDILSLQQDPAPRGSTPRRTLTLSCSSGDTGRSKPSLTYWTNAHQRIRSPDDTFCNMTYRYQVSQEVIWPRF